MRARVYVSAVALGPSTTPAGSAPSRSATAERASATSSNDRRPGTKAALRLPTAARMASATASITPAAVWVPPAPSKWTKPSVRAGYAARVRAMSNGMSRTLAGAPATPSGHRVITDRL